MTGSEQLGFGFDEMLHEQETAHLPGAMEEAIPYFRKLIERHHEAMIAATISSVPGTDPENSLKLIGTRAPQAR